MSDEIDTEQIEFVSLMLRRAVSEMAAEICDQCGKCSAACPVARHMEGFNPRQLVTKVYLGRIEELLRSDVNWNCTSCLKCRERCPENISPYDVILVLRNLAVRAGYDYPSGYDEFISTVIEYGIAQQPQIVRTRTRERRDRASLGLPSVDRPRDLEKFGQILSRIVRAGRSG